MRSTILHRAAGRDRWKPFQILNRSATRSTGVERRYASNSSHWHKSVCMSSTPRAQGRTTMKRVCTLTIGTLGLLLLGVVLSTGAVCAQTAKDLAGTWTLVSADTVRPDGSRVPTFGASPKGILVFTDD